MTAQHATTASGAVAESGEDWLPRTKIAELARVDEQTIKRDAKRHDLPFRVGPNGSHLFNVADFVAIGRLQPTDIPNGLTASQAVEVLRLQEQVAALLRDNGELRGRLDEVRTARDLLQAQLAAKDAQIKAADANLQRALTLATRSAA